MRVCHTYSKNIGSPCCPGSQKGLPRTPPEQLIKQIWYNEYFLFLCGISQQVEHFFASLVQAASLVMEGVEAHSCGVRLAAETKMYLGDTDMIIIYQVVLRTKASIICFDSRFRCMICCLAWALGASEKTRVVCAGGKGEGEVTGGEREEGRHRGARFNWVLVAWGVGVSERKF